jgi:hypothetical protein
VPGLRELLHLPDLWNNGLVVPHISRGSPDLCLENKIFEDRPYYLGNACLSPGNIVLTSGVKASTTGAIRGYQRIVSALKPDEANQRSWNAVNWTHVGLVGLGKYIWDINPGKNVRRQTLSNFLDGKEMACIRRLNIDTLDSQKLQENIEILSRSKYPPMDKKTLTIFLKNLVDFGTEPVRFEEDEYICSLFVDRVLRATTGQEICPQSSSPIVLPYHLAASPVFKTLPIYDLIGQFQE